MSNIAHTTRPIKQPSPALLAHLTMQGDQLAATGTKWVDYIFPKMVERWGYIEAIERLMLNGDIQPGFRKCVELGRADCTLEAAVIAFPNEFTRGARECAEWRLANARTL